MGTQIPDTERTKMLDQEFRAAAAVATADVHDASPASSSEVMTMQEAARFLCVSSRTFRALRKGGSDPVCSSAKTRRKRVGSLPAFATNKMASATNCEAGSLERSERQAMRLPRGVYERNGIL